ncbi:NAD(P)H-hydrate dehydratase [Sediminimonas sp.]|uniref:NAD(P)H-hydrate dehydratase n=1 Tax=Sediminimonas sp. TaxID=2823379 RepID=UPI0025D76F5E|nr:NAD(P)H-hydrate dehydratase [Sediminimonas sp.]
MAELLTAAQMRAIERAAIESGAVTGLELMERAGRGVVEAVFEEWPDLAQAPHKAVVLCGPGNNGGDGFVVARLLGEWGWQVEVFLYGSPDKLPPDAKTNYERWGALGEVNQLDPARLFGADGGVKHADLWVDALFGTGLARPLSDEALIRGVTSLNEVSSLGLVKVVAVDIPSGVCADSGRVLECSEKSVETGVHADLSVSFHRAKAGHFLADGSRCSLGLIVKDIGLEGSPRPPDDVVGLVERASLPDLGKAAQTHKYTHGHALVLSGGAGRTGAARLAARGALRIGAGLVTLGVPGSAQMEVASRITALMLKRIDDADGLAGVLEDARVNALCLGPGLGIARAQDLVPAALSAGRAVVLDADALTAFGDDPAALFALLHDKCVLTPHGGEFARLFPDIADKLNATATKGPAYSKVDATRAAAERAGCIVLFKGPDTVIAAPDGRCSISSAQYERAAPWLATAGAGDVLAGFITGLLARGFAPMQAAETAAFCHVECARCFGPGLIAEDLPEALPAVLRDLGVP